MRDPTLTVVRLRYLPAIRPPLFTAAVAGDSMLPEYRCGDWVLVLRTPRVRVGDAVAARDPRQPDRILVKRVQRRDPDGLWLVGDNPSASTDSRTFGAVPHDLVLGRILLRYYPLRRPSWRSPSG
jgi:nickel-type superoxide dismutase maturation protease